MLLFVFSVAIALMVSFLCSLAEAALLSSSIARVEALARKGNPAAEILRRFKAQPDVPIAAILILNTIAHTAGAAVAGATVEDALPGTPAWLFVAIFTLAVLLLTEILPKTLGVLYGEKLLVPVAYSVDMAARLLAPAIWFSKESPGSWERVATARWCPSRKSGCWRPPARARAPSVPSRQASSPTRRACVRRACARSWCPATASPT